MPSVNLTQTRTNEPNGTFKIHNKINSAVDMPVELFVFEFTDSLFNHVATLTDFQYPNTPTMGLDWYRQDECEKSFDNVEQAVEFASHVRNRLLALTEYYTEDFANFVGVDTYDIPTP